VTLVDQDHIGWKSWKLFSINPTPSLFVAQRRRAIHLRQGNIWGNFGETWGGVGKSGMLEHNKLGAHYL